MKSLRLKRVSLSHDLKRASRSNHARIYTKTAQLYRVYHHRQRNKAITKKHVSLPFRGSFLEACNVCARRCVKSNRGRKGTKRKETKGNDPRPISTAKKTMLHPRDKERGYWIYSHTPTCLYDRPYRYRH